ncbi:hypothetical protein LSTR_LSTR013966 [Laodelphax striatellus]|uniref:Uncharacterized protein n=1 Tax=Laodelphax striatellus TaxID=195883 RepID=A0A482X084_LAOST|nr:hypothetical protein LSTR_LSTR013966 [Laodelphax striatellus]
MYKFSEHKNQRYGRNTRRMGKKRTEKKERKRKRETGEMGGEVGAGVVGEAKQKDVMKSERVENHGGTPAVAHPPGTHTATGAPSKAPPQFKLICRNTSHIPAAILALPNAVLVTFAASLPPE